MDAVQALMSTFDAIRIDLERAEAALTWEGAPVGVTGFARVLPYYYGLQFYRRVERIVDKEIERFTKQVERRSLRRTARKRGPREPK